MKFNKRERKIFVFTIIVASGALLYIYVIEPAISTIKKQAFLKSEGYDYAELAGNKAEIENKYTNAFSSNYWKLSMEEQQVSVQTYLEELIRSAGITELISIRPLMFEQEAEYEEIPLQLNLRCSVNALTKLLYKVGTSPLPLRVKRMRINGDENSAWHVRSQIDISMLWIPGRKNEF